MNASEALRLDLDILARDLARWAARDDSEAQTEVRQAADTAMRAIDRMLTELHRVRSQLVTETRQSDNATAARVDAMLAGRHVATSADQVSKRPRGVVIRPICGRRS